MIPARHRNILLVILFPHLTGKALTVNYIECIESLKQCIQDLYDTLRHSGIGALPLLAPNSKSIPNEQQLLSDASRSVQVLYETLKRSQDSAAVVANLLGGDAQRSTK
jgi:hypothetical protein